MVDEQSGNEKERDFGVAWADESGIVGYYEGLIGAEVGKSVVSAELLAMVRKAIDVCGGDVESVKDKVHEALSKDRMAGLTDIMLGIIAGAGTEKVKAVKGLGALERAVVDMVAKAESDTIARRIARDLRHWGENFIRSEYGSVCRKVDLDIGGKRVDMGREVLHEKFDTVLQFVSANEPVFLTGQAGCGKNVLCKQVAKALGLDFYFTNAVTQEYKLTGFTDAMGQFHETQFYKAFKNGGLFMLDEMDASIPEVLVILNSAIANRYFDFPAPIGYVEAHPNFRVIGAGNTFGLGADIQYVGRNQLDMASLDRFALVEMDYDRGIEESVAGGDLELVEFAHLFREGVARAGVRALMSYRSIGRIAKLQGALGLENALRTCLVKSLQKDDLQMVLGYMQKGKGNKYYEALVAIKDKA